MVIFLMKRKGRNSGGKKGGQTKKGGYDFFSDKKMGPVKSPPTQKKKSGLKCPSCGTSSPMHDRFCTVCGKPLTKNPAAAKGMAGKVKWAETDEKKPQRKAKGRTKTSTARSPREGVHEKGQTLIKCWVCGTKFSGKQKFCTICGSPKEKNVQNMSCQICGAALQKNERFCIVCGSSQEKKAQNMSCQFCGAVLSENERFCMDCGSPRVEKIQENVCEGCGAVLSENEEFCSICGTRPVRQYSEKNDEAKIERKANARYYKILELEPGATQTEIKKAYKRKIIEYHPDKVHSLGERIREIAEEETKKITEAYRALMNE